VEQRPEDVALKRGQVRELAELCECLVIGVDTIRVVGAILKRPRVRSAHGSQTPREEATRGTQPVGVPAPAGFSREDRVNYVLVRPLQIAY
jgi:hypothetical protein